MIAPFLLLHNLPRPISILQASADLLYFNAFIGKQDNHTCIIAPTICNFKSFDESKYKNTTRKIIYMN